MTNPAATRCSDLEAAGFDAQRAATETWQVMLNSGMFIEGEFTFASGAKATIKADTEQLYGHPEQLEVILGHYAAFPCVQDADVLLYVPDGWREFTTMLGDRLGKPIAHTIRKPNAVSRYDFAFRSPDDELLAREAERPFIGEDIVTTLGSVAGVRRLLRPEQTAHSLAMLLRGTVNPVYQTGLTDHYLLQREIPLDKVEFQRRLREGWT